MTSSISVAQRLRVEVGRAGAVVRGPLGHEVERDLLVVVGHDLSGRDVDDGRDADAPVVAGVAAL
jgi:hypothetical protein